MALMAEVAVSQSIKYGEVTCGDAVEIVPKEDGMVIVLSDGLGSGVKANILSNLTTKIASKMIVSDISIDIVVETLAETLPVCSERGIAYSTFSILKVCHDGNISLFDFDGCPALHIKQNHIDIVKTKSRVVSGRQINECSLKLLENEALLISSDGVTQAGLGVTTITGLETQGVIDTLEPLLGQSATAQQLADRVLETSRSYDLSQSGDDTTVVVLKMRQSKQLALMSGPPKDPKKDESIVHQFRILEGQKVICGGTTAQIYSTIAQKEISTQTKSVNEKVPPISFIQGVDLVTEGAVTMGRCLELLRQQVQPTGELDGASLLLKKLLSADEITMLIGTVVNEAHENMESQLQSRQQVLQNIAEQLEKRGKRVKMLWW